MNDRRGEQGGIVEFLLIGFLIVALLGGAILLVKYQSHNAMTPSTTTDQTSGKTDNSDTTSDQPRNVDTTEGDTAQGDAAPSTLPADTSTGSTVPTSGSTPTTGPSTAQPTPSVAQTGPSSVEEIPSTGLGSVLMSVTSVGLVSAGTYAYAQSHKRVRASALK